MRVIFGTTNKRKIEDLKSLIVSMDLNIEVLGLNDIDFLGEIEETGKTLEENSLIKARKIQDFCKNNNFNYPIITDDSGLFVEALNGEPGIYTGRYADYELSHDKNLPKYQCVIKLLTNLEGVLNRKAKYKCVVTCILNGSFFQEVGESEGVIAKEIIGSLEKPYFYSIFILNEYQKVFSNLEKEELQETYRYKALRKTLKKIDNNT